MIERDSAGKMDTFFRGFQWNMTNPYFKIKGLDINI